MKSLHPYAIMIGVGITAAMFVALRFLPFALLIGLCATVLIDMGLKSSAKSDDDNDS